MNNLTWNFGDATSALTWMQQLAQPRPACFLGVEDSSLTPHYALVARGLAGCAYPRGATPALRERLAADLEVWERIPWQSWLR